MAVEQHGQSCHVVAHCQYPQTLWLIRLIIIFPSKLHHKNGDQQKEEQEPPAELFGLLTQNWATHGRTFRRILWVKQK